MHYSSTGLGKILVLHQLFVFVVIVVVVVDVVEVLFCFCFLLLFFSLLKATNIIILLSEEQMYNISESVVGFMLFFLAVTVGYIESKRIPYVEFYRTNKRT